ncbi:MAG TPA: hypothetical protein VLW86_12415 [Syntrophorhabdales bacterium]|nr:hypothetical protein [Syntrophorhabdales bacterium]
MCLDVKHATALGMYVRTTSRTNNNGSKVPGGHIDLAVTKEGIPVRSWVLPGNTQDAKTVETAKKDLAGWKFSRCVWVADRGMNSEENRRILQTASGHHTLGAKLGDDIQRCSPGKDNTRSSGTTLGEGGQRRRRFILVSNREEAEKDKAMRAGTSHVLKRPSRP